MKRFLQESALIYEEVVPVADVPAERSDLPVIVNVVSTVCMLPADSGLTMPLEHINRVLLCSQFASKLFAANILKFTDALADVTALLFRSGMMVLVSCMSMNHMLYMNQFIRLLIEQIFGPHLRGVTRLRDCRVHNIVGHGDLGCVIDLQSMCDAAPTCCKWAPLVFPGLKCRIWLTPDFKCHCAASAAAATAVASETTGDAAAAYMGNPGKCSCVIKVLIFDRGRIVITGSKSIADINTVFYRIKKLAPSFKSVDGGAAVIPRENRFYHRLTRLLVPMHHNKPLLVPAAAAAAAAANDEPKSKKARASIALPKDNSEHCALLAPTRELTPDEAIALVISSVESHATYQRRPFAVASAPPAFLMAETGQVANLQTLLSMEPTELSERRSSSGQTVLEYMRLLPKSQRPEAYEAVIELLEKSQTTMRAHVITPTTV